MVGRVVSTEKTQLTLKVATGSFEGLSGIGTWHPIWPKERRKPRIPDGYDAVIAQEYTFDVPEAVYQ